MCEHDISWDCNADDFYCVKCGMKIDKVGVKEKWSLILKIEIVVFVHGLH